MYFYLLMNKDFIIIIIITCNFGKVVFRWVLFAPSGKTLRAAQLLHYRSIGGKYENSNKFREKDFIFLTSERFKIPR